MTVVATEDFDIQSVRAVPDFRIARSVVSFDAQPSMLDWKDNTVPWIKRANVLDPEERHLWRLFERGLFIVQTGDATRPLTTGT